MKKLPNARNRDIIVQELGGELLIYNLKSSKAYALNETSAAVYRACDGTTSFGDLCKEYKFTDELIFLALDELKRENLIEDEDFSGSPLAGMSRREVIRKVGLGTMIALPLISSLVAPTAVMAQSGGGAGGGGTTPPGGFYLSGNCTTGSACSTTCATTGPSQCTNGMPAIVSGCGSFCVCQCVGGV